MNERLIAAARAVVQRWHSIDWKAPHTADLIRELDAAANALAAQPARAGGDAQTLVTVGAMHQCRCTDKVDVCVHCGAMAEELSKPCNAWLNRADAALAAAPAPVRAGGDAPSEPKCLDCGGALCEVKQDPNSYLNAEQFEADKLGDWFCDCCPKGPSAGSRKHRYFWNSELAAAPQPAVTNAQAVGYLDLGVGGYMDIGTDLSDEQLAALPKGRHMLAIIGTHGVDGYQPALWAAPQPAAAEPRKMSGTALQALEALDELEASARGDEPFNHFAGAVVRQYIESTIATQVEQPAASTVPAGWKVVPVEPTEEMLAAAHESDREYTLRNFGDVMTVQQGPHDHYVAMLAAAPAAPAAVERKPLTDAQIEKGREATFSTNNPFCPCDSKTMRKAVRWAEHAHGIGSSKEGGAA